MLPRVEYERRHRGILLLLRALVQTMSLGGAERGHTFALGAVGGATRASRRAPDDARAHLLSTERRETR